MKISQVDITPQYFFHLFLAPHTLCISICLTLYKLSNPTPPNPISIRMKVFSRLSTTVHSGTLYTSILVTLQLYKFERPF